MNINNVVITGRLTRDPQLKKLNTGIDLTNISIAVNEKYKNEVDVSYFNCSAFGKLAEVLNEYFKKGDRINIVGKLKQNRWQDKDGKMKERIEIIIQQLEFVESKKNKTIEQSNEIPEPIGDMDTPF